MEDQILAWLATKTTAVTIGLLTTAVGVLVQALKVTIGKLRALAGFKRWWIVGGAAGTAAGLLWIEPSLAGAVAGLVIGVLATGGYEYLGGGLAILKRLGAAGMVPLLWSLALLPLLGLSGCALPQAVLQTVQFEQAQHAGDKDLLNQLFDGRRAANERLIAAVDVATQLSIMRREREAAAWAAAHPDARPRDDKDKQPAFTSAWIIETMQGAEVAKAVLRERIDADERARATAVANLEDRDRALAGAGKLVVKSQQWSSETQSLVEDLLAKGLKGLPAVTVPPLVASPQVAAEPPPPPQAPAAPPAESAGSR